MMKEIWPEAEKEFKHSLEYMPEQIPTLTNLIAVLIKVKKYKEASELVQKALVLAPDDLQILMNYGQLLLVNKNFRDALKNYERILYIKPNYAEGYLNCGIALIELGRTEEALISFGKALSFKPDYAEAYFNLGNSLKSLGRIHEALDNYERAISIKPEYPEAHFNRGVVLFDLKLLNEAFNSFQHATNISPDYTYAHINSGISLLLLGNLDEALSKFDRAIVINPHIPETYLYRANTLKKLKRFNEASINYESAITLKSDYAEAYSDYGNLLKDLQLLEKAICMYESALKHKPDFAIAYSNRGAALFDLMRFEEAEASYRKALSFDPNNFSTHSNLILSMNYSPSLNQEYALKESLKFGCLVSKKSIPKFSNWNLKLSDKKLKIGFVSGDLNNHPVGYFIEGLIESIDTTLFELNAFTTNWTNDNLTDRIKPFFVNWIPIHHLSDFDAAKVIHKSGIHILIDLSGHTAHNRLPVFGYKPSPIQISWLGYFATTGMKEIDYFLGDPYLLPDSEASHFFEKTWKLPDSWFCLKPPISELPIEPLPAQKNGFITFGSFVNLSKLNEEVIETWASILSNVENSKLLMKSKQFSDDAQIYIVQKRFEKYGISTNKLILERPDSKENYLRAYNRIDMLLDTFPFPGGTTSVDALWMGVPVLTLKGDKFVSHFGETIAINAGFPDWISNSVNEYINKAVLYSSDLPLLSHLRSTLRNQVLTTPLYDTKRFAKNFGNALRDIWIQFTRNLY